MKRVDDDQRSEIVQQKNRLDMKDKIISEGERREKEQAKGSEKHKTEIEKLNKEKEKFESKCKSKDDTIERINNSMKELRMKLNNLNEKAKADKGTIDGLKKEVREKIKRPWRRREKKKRAERKLKSCN